MADTIEGYVGRIVVTKSVKTEQQVYRNGVQDRKVDRHSTEILDVTVRASTEYGVRDKLEQALGLLESASIIAERPGA